MLDQRWRLWGGNLATRDLDYLAALLLVNIKNQRMIKEKRKLFQRLFWSQSRGWFDGFDERPRLCLKLTNWAPGLTPIETARFLKYGRYFCLLGETRNSWLCVKGSGQNNFWKRNREKFWGRNNDLKFPFINDELELTLNNPQIMGWIITNTPELILDPPPFCSCFGIQNVDDLTFCKGNFSCAFLIVIINDKCLPVFLLVN